MKKSAVCFTDKGRAIVEKINKAAGEEFLGLKTDDKSMEDWTRENFEEGNALVFIGAVGIAVRFIAPFVKDKLSDSPVIVVDDGGNFVIPILSGHVGGANKIAETIAKLLGAVPVITTSTDVNGAFSADTFAVENRLSIANREGIKKVSARAIEGKAITLSIKNYPPKDPVDIIVADETDAEYSLLMKPKPYVVGLGMKKDKDEAEILSFFAKTIDEQGIEPDEIYAISTIDIKEKEPAIKALRDKYKIPVITFDKDLLLKAKGDFTGSEFVKETVGVDNVCERAAILATGNRGELILKKTVGEGMTIAIARRN
ncbi:MAG: cobalt-precorrin 5A hydrolase [Lachnospiraceae bacterium]|nr:cobalt-precorrin 5A hydrolase [Lachnospiraceae bacterium]